MLMIDDIHWYGLCELFMLFPDTFKKQYGASRHILIRSVDVRWYVLPQTVYECHSNHIKIWV